MCSLMNGIGLDIDNEENHDEHLDELLVVDVVEPNNKKKSSGSVNLERKLGSAQHVLIYDFIN